MVDRANDWLRHNGADVLVKTCETVTWMAPEARQLGDPELMVLSKSVVDGAVTYYVRGLRSVDACFNCTNISQANSAFQPRPPFDKSRYKLTSFGLSYSFGAAMFAASDAECGRYQSAIPLTRDFPYLHKLLLCPQCCDEQITARSLAVGVGFCPYLSRSEVPV